MKEYSLYPNGYLGTKNHEHHDGEPSEKVEDFYSSLEMSPSLIISKYGEWSLFFANVVGFVYDEFLVDGFSSFVLTNLSNKDLDNCRKRFLLDTISYIKTGYRQISVESWVTLLSSDTPTNVTIPNYDDIVNSIDDKTFLSDWLKHPNGLRDLVWSLKIIFGKSSLIKQ